MSLAPGTKLGPYEVVSPLGEGGMGEVYRARDTKLNRDVALKILPETFASDPDRAARFTREAQTLAALNHPNIAAIYGVGEADQDEPGSRIPDPGSRKRQFLVMELVEGQDLSDLIAGGAEASRIPLDEALAIARQIADALEAAHEAGIVHRDLKPANVKVRDDGTVKVLDFGLAKALAPEGAGATADAMSSPTMTSPALTQMGMILGTAAYMAPEQARGKAVDRRADIWAFGVVLYEMLTGRRAFKGEDVGQTLARVVERAPDFDALPSSVPARVRQVLQACLQKNPKQRLGDMQSVRLALEGAFETSAPQATAGAHVHARFRGLLPWAVALVLALVAAAGWMRSPSGEPAEAPRSLVSLTPTGSPLRTTPLISPDGSAVVFPADSGMLYRRLDTADPTPVPAGNLRNGFWADDSTTFIYLDPNDRVLKKVRLPDGAPENLAEPLPGNITVADFIPFGSVGAGGTILFAALLADSASPTLTASARILTVPPTGGTPTVVDVEDLQRHSLMAPQFVDRTEDFLFLDRGEGVVYVATLQNGAAINPVRLMPSRTNAVYTPAGGGRLLFVRDDNLYAQPYDRVARALTGAPELIQTGVASRPGNWQAHFSVSRAGTVAFRPGHEEMAQVTTFDRRGTEMGVSGSPRLITTLRLAPDGTRLLAANNAGAWLLEPGRPGDNPLSEGSSRALWSPSSGTSILAERLGADRVLFIERAAFGTGEARELPTPPGFARIQDVSLDGRTLLFNRGALDTAVFAVPVDGTGADPTSLVQTGEVVMNTRFAPDGRWIVYVAGPRSGINANTVEGAGIYAQPFPGPGLRRQIASRGNQPVWRRDGKEIIYVEARAGRTYVVSVPVTWRGAEPQFGEPAPLFPFRPNRTSFVDMNYLDVSGDGSRIYIAQGVAQPETDVVHLRIGAIQ